MGGYDFGILWQAGRAVWLGQDPYGVEGFFYPLPVAYFFALLALFRKEVAFGLWILVNLAILGWMLRRRAIGWLLYFPVIHLLSSGQVDLVLWALGYRLTRGWPSALAAAVITLKPQVALIILPWHLWRWLREDRHTLKWFVLISAVIWGFSFPLDPSWPLRWRAAVPPLGRLSRSNSPGIWSLEKLTPYAWPILTAVSIALFIWGLSQTRPVGWAATALASPSGLFYDLLILMETAPPHLLVPLSWIAVGLTLWWNNFVAWASLPVAVILYHKGKERRGRLWIRGG